MLRDSTKRPKTNVAETHLLCGSASNEIGSALVFYGDEADFVFCVVLGLVNGILHFNKGLRLVELNILRLCVVYVTCP